MYNLKYPITPPYYDPSALFDKKPNVAATIGGRGIGKTNFWKRYAIYNFLQRGKQTIFLKRFKGELKAFKDNFLNDIFVGDPELENHKYAIKGNHLYVDGKIAAYFISLSQSITLTGVSYQDVDFMLFDEFLTLGMTVRGVDEETLFMHYLETVFRAREEFLVVMTSNAISSTSLYFDMLGFPDGIDVQKRFQSPRGRDGSIKGIVVEVYKDKVFQEFKSKSKLYQLFEASEYQKFAIENQFIGEDHSDIRGTVKGHLPYYCSLLTGEGMLEVVYYSKFKPYVRAQVRPPHKDDVIYTFDKEQVRFGAIFITASHSVANFLHGAIYMKAITYENMKTKKIFLGDIKKIITTYY